MRKLIFTFFIAAAMFSTGLSQEQQQLANSPQIMDDATNMGRAPSGPNGIGRLDLRVVDESGSPVSGAYATLRSIWVKAREGEQLCESFGATNERGAIALPPIHMGTLKLKVKAKGYRTQEIEVPTSSLAQPVRVTLARKR